MIRYLHISCFLTFLFTIYGSDLLGQEGADTTIYLDTVSAKHGSVTICDYEHHHPVDLKAKLIFDSLRGKGVDSIIIYRHWLGTNGFNGYGKVIWQQKGILKQYRINFVNEHPYYGIKSIKYSVWRSENIFNYFFQNNLQRVVSNPEKQEEWMSHDSDHFFYLVANGTTYCFNIAGLLMKENPRHLRSQLIRKLTIEPIKYINEIYNK